MIQSSKDLAQIFRAESGRVLAALIMYSKDIDLAEDALQDSCLQAIEQWSIKGTPKNKGAWLLTVAKRRLIDKLRRNTYQNKDKVLQNVYFSLNKPEIVEIDDSPIPDERLKLIFTCCHPAISKEARVYLTLKTLCGFNSREIARAFLTSEVTMNKRLTRAKKKIKLSGIMYEIPEKDSLKLRLDSVLSVIYLIYNESYSAYEGQSLTREDLANEAIRLGRVVDELMPNPSIKGLLALMLFQKSRFISRSSEVNSFIPLENQNRSLWDKNSILEADKILLEAIKENQVDKYQILAAINSLHSEAESWDKTDWKQIQLLYLTLYNLEPSPIILLNQYVSLAHSGEYKLAFDKLKLLEDDLDKYQPYHASLGYILKKLNQKNDSLKHYEKAVKLTKNNVERDFLLKQIKSLKNNIIL